jgi:hypothetical protein
MGSDRRGAVWKGAALEASGRGEGLAHHVFGSIGRGLRISVTLGSWKVCMSASWVWVCWMRDGARLGARGGRRGGYVVTRAARRRMRSRRARVALAATMASATPTESAIDSHGVSSDGSGDCATVSGSASP